MSIFTKFAQVKAEGGVRQIVQWLAQADPKGMSEAELREMDAALDKVGAEVVKARNDYNREEAEHVAIVKVRDQRLRAAELLQADIGKLPEGSTERGSKEKSLNTLLTLLEKMQPDVERETREAAEAKQDLADIESAHTEAVERFKNARTELAAAQREMASAARDKQRGKTAEERAAIAAGVRQSGSGITSALNAMKDIAKRDRDAAAASRLKANALKPDQPEKEDPNIAAAMRKASGAPPAPTSAADRLAALQKQAQAAQ